jgi:hypothetical protein
MLIEDVERSFAREDDIIDFSERQRIPVVEVLAGYSQTP